MDRSAGDVFPGSPLKFFQSLTENLCRATRIVVANQHMNLPTDMRALDIPLAGRHVWKWFVDVDHGRSGESLSYADIEAWGRVCEEIVRPWEARALLAMDLARRAEIQVLAKQ